MTFTPIFSDFFYKENLNIDIKFLETYLKEVMDVDEGRTVSNYGGYQSNNLDNNEYTFPLLEKVSENIQKVSNIIGIKKQGLKLHNFWLNINSKKDFNLPHVHPQSIISGVFYIKSPPNCGNLMLKNRNADLVKSYFDYWHLKEETDYAMNEITSQSWRIVPEENHLIIFPSWVEHYVEPNESDKERISISFNYGY
jgi:uncharacterized protein (TIGR02466 family)